MSPTIIFGLVLLEAGLGFGQFEWSYRGQDGPKTWSKGYPLCGGKQQSPIFLKDFEASKKPQLTWSGFDKKPDKMVLHNTGTTVELVGEGVLPNITLDGGKVYDLDNVHFHWGKKDSQGSEHQLNGRRFSMEMQAVYFLSEEKDDSPQQMDILVIAVFLDAKPNHGNEGMRNFAGKMKDVIQTGSETQVDPFPWSELLHPFDDDFVWYQGSLTSPPCIEGVTFIVKKTPNYLTNSQMDMFRQLLDVENKPISGNFRPLQKLNGRTIYEKS